VEDSYLQVELDGTDLDSRSPRRLKLDPALQRAALDLGVDARDRHAVTALVRDGDRVTGVRVTNGSREYDLRAPLVVGADGRNSTIAKLAGAEDYNNPLTRMIFERAQGSPATRARMHRMMVRELRPRSR
jgi:2-polyprenyl-6-methoxyphenol hydroxylase-like FAD-dependent oxidoreductase